MDVYHVYCERNPPQKTIDTKVPPYVKIAHTAITPHCLNCLHSLHCLHSLKIAVRANTMCVTHVRNIMVLHHVYWHVHYVC